MFSLIEFQPVERERIVSKAILKLFDKTDLELTPQLNPNLKEIDHIPYEQIDSILGPVKGKNDIVFGYLTSTP